MATAVPWGEAAGTPPAPSNFVGQLVQKATLLLNVHLIAVIAAHVGGGGAVSPMAVAAGGPTAVAAGACCASLAAAGEFLPLAKILGDFWLVCFGLWWVFSIFTLFGVCVFVFGCDCQWVRARGCGHPPGRWWVLGLSLLGGSCLCNA